MSHTIGLDIGGTRVKAAVADNLGRIVYSITFDTPRQTSELDMSVFIARVCHDTLAAAFTVDHTIDVKACGIGVPGVVDFVEQRILRAVNVPSLDGCCSADFSAACGLPVIMDNDVNMMGIAEASIGAAQGYSDIVALTIGTGIGGALLFGGQLYRGNSFCAGEIGHMSMVPEGIKCNCGNTGCLEQYAARDAIVRVYMDAAGIKEPGSIEPKDVYLAALKGNSAAISAWNSAGRYLGIAFASLVNLLSPQIFVVGGGISAAGEFLLGPARAEMGRRAFPIAFGKTKLVSAALGNDAGVSGAALLAQKTFLL